MKKIKCAKCGKVCSVGRIDIGELKNLKNYSCPECGILYFHEDEGMVSDDVIWEMEKAKKETRYD